MPSNFNHELIPTLKYLFIYLLGLFSAAFGNYVNYRLNDHKDKRAGAVDAYRRLMGLKIVIAQSVVTRFEALIFSNYHERKVQIMNTGEESVDFREAQRWMAKSGEGVKEITQAIQSISESCATLSWYFRRRQDIQKLIDQSLIFENYNVSAFEDCTSIESLTQARDSAVQELQQRVEKKYLNSLGKLLSVIKKALF